MKHRFFTCCLAATLTCGAGFVHAQDEQFDIVRFDVRGNTLLPAAQIQALVAPFVGRGKVYGDIQKALEAVENAYRSKGFGTVDVHVPEQEITTGVIRLDVTEAVVGKLVITGNKHFDEANIRASLPNLKEGTAPNLRQISENVQLINENPAKQVEVSLGVSEEEGKVDAKVNLTEDKVERYIVTFDNTGTDTTGRHRLGLAYQNANLQGGDEMLTLAYTGSPDVWIGYPQGVNVDVFSVAYRKPFYNLGDSLDIIYGNSSVNVPSSVLALGSAYGIVGKGDIWSIRWNHLFPRRGEYASRLVVGYDNKFINSACSPDQRGTVSTCTPYTLRPISATYTATIQGIGYQMGYNVGVAYNALPTGSRYAGTGGSPAAGHTDYYSFITNRPVRDEFVVFRYGANYAKLLPEGLQFRAVLTGQFADSALPPAEQFGMAGTTAVRGFDERAVSADIGNVVNLELYTPNIANKVGVPGNLNLVLFYDAAQGRNIDAQNTPFNVTSVASVGIGLRYAMQKDWSLSVDSANILDTGPNNLGRRNRWGGNFKLMMSF